MKTVRNKTTKLKEFLGGQAPFKAKLAHGSWMDAWSGEGMDATASASKVPIVIIVDIALGGRVYTYTATTIYSSKTTVGGKFKK